MNIRGQINGIEIDIRKPDPAKLVKDGVWYEIIAYRCPEAKETSYSSVNEKIQTWFARPMFEIGYWILHPIPRPTPEWLKATGYTASEMPEEYKVGDVIFSDHFATSSVIEKSKTHRRRYLLTSKLFEPEKKTPKQPAQPEPVEEHTGCSGCKSTLPFPECVRSCVDDTTGIRRNWTPAPPQPPAPVKEKETHPSGHRYNSVENLIKDILFKEPPAPDISKGVWFQSEGSDKWCKGRFVGQVSAVMADGKMFVTVEHNRQLADEYEDVVRWLARWIRKYPRNRSFPISMEATIKKELWSIEDEATRLHPEGKGE